MKRLLTVAVLHILIGCSVFAQTTEKMNPFVGDWKAKTGKYFAQVYITKDSMYKVNLTTDLTSRAAPEAVLAADVVKENVLNLSGDGWNGKIENGALRMAKGSEVLDMQQYF